MAEKESMTSMNEVHYPPGTQIQEFTIRVPKNLKRNHHVMRFNAALNVDFNEWKSVKIARENSVKDTKATEEETPKFGAGSEYNRDQREEFRRKKFGYATKSPKVESQPYILKVGGKTGKKFRGIREGGVSENAAFYVFTHAPDGAIEAYPLHEWYNFQPIQRYKSLSAEEAEHEFGRRNKVLNYFSLMLRKRLKGEDDEENDNEENKSKGSLGKSKELKISEMDEWMDSDDDDSDDDEDDDPETRKKKKTEDYSFDGKKSKNKKKSNTAQGQKKKKKNDDDEAFEESDDGDEEGRELDYTSDSSDEEPDPEAKIDKQLKSVAEEDALRKLLTSDEEEDDEKKFERESDKDDNENKKESKDTKDNKDKKKKKLKKKGKDEKKDSSSDSDLDSSDSETEGKKKKKDTANASNSRSASPSISTMESNKRKICSMPTDLSASENSNSPNSTPAKKPKLDTPSLPATFAGVVNASSKDDSGITEEAVRRYLMRKPMTATELLTKFKNKKTGVSSDKLVETMTQILKKINPVKQTIQGKMYLSIKVNK